MRVAMEIEALRELSEEELIDRLGEVRQFMRDLKEENQNILSLLEWGNKSEIAAICWRFMKTKTGRAVMSKK
jgi:hypothetical protein